MPHSPHTTNASAYETSAQVATAPNHSSLPLLALFVRSSYRPEVQPLRLQVLAIPECARLRCRDRRLRRVWESSLAPVGPPPMLRRAPQVACDSGATCSAALRTPAALRTSTSRSRSRPAR